MDTILHMDITDAINIPVYIEGQGEESKWWLGDEAHTLWLLWQCEDVEPLRENLLDHFQLGWYFDPINIGDLHINMLEVFEVCRIWPYVVCQWMGQAVIIPALTPHYVCLYKDQLLVKLILLFCRPSKLLVISCLSKIWTPLYKSAKTSTNTTFPRVKKRVKTSFSYISPSGKHGNTWTPLYQNPRVIIGVHIHLPSAQWHKSFDSCNGILNHL